ncbi:hypothetical protein GCK32_011699, partial [Trichostrongylus colubriformis]
MVTSQPALPLIPEMYGNYTYSYVSLWDRDPSSLSYKIMESFEEPPDMGTRCVNNIPVFRSDLPTSKVFWIGKKKPEQLVAGCDRTVGNGTFHWNANETEIPYNADVNCQCMDTLVWNCTAKDYPLDSIPTVTLNTTMRVLDMSYRNISQMRKFQAWFNNKLYTSLPIFTSFLSNALLRVESHDTDPSDLGIVTVNHPMNQTVKSSIDAQGSSKLIVFRIVLIVLVLCVIPAGFTVFLVEERVCDAFHLQLVSGLSRRTYWLTGYVFDMSIYIISVIAILLIYVIFDVKEFAYSFEALCSFFLVFLLYGLCAVLWAYILQRRFEVPALSFVMISIGTFFVGIVASLTVIVIEQLMQQDPTLIGPHNVCSMVFLILPQYNLGMAIFRGSFVFQLIQLGENFLKELNRPDLASSLP